MYGTSGVIHVWYIRCDSSGVIEMPPPASRQARPAIQQRGAHAANRGPGGPGPRCWIFTLVGALPNCPVVAQNRLTDDPTHQQICSQIGNTSIWGVDRIETQTNAKPM